MPDLHTALRGFLLDDVAVSDFVEDRIYAVHLPEGAHLPAIALQQVSAPRRMTYDPGPQRGWVTKRMQVTCWSNSLNEAFDLGDAVLTALSGVSGDMEGLLIGSTVPANELEDYEARTKLYRRILDFQISYDNDQDETSS